MPTRSKESLVNIREQYVAKLKAQLDQWNA
jgi:hypothetical protein